MVLGENEANMGSRSAFSTQLGAFLRLEEAGL